MADRQIFRVANSNAANFNHPGVRYAGRPDPDGAPIDRGVYDSKVAWLSSLFEKQAVDIVGFEELFHKDALEALIKATPRFREAYVFAPDLETNVSNGEASGPFCGIVSKFPLSNQQAIRDFPPEVKEGLKVLAKEADPTSVFDVRIGQFQRPVLRVDAALPFNNATTNVTIFVAHLKSKREQFLEGEDQKSAIAQALGAARSLIVRAAEAAALRALVVAAMKGNDNPTIVLGDLNDDLTSVTTQMIAGDDPFFLKGPAKAQALDTLLYSAHDIQEHNSHRSVAYSHIYNGYYELLDHIFVSKELVYPTDGRVAEVRNTRVFNDHLFDTRLESDRSVRAMSTSDHGVPICEIEWRAATPQAE